MSYPLVKLVQKKYRKLFKRYPYLTSADHILMTCVNDFGVSVTINQGLHQIDLHGDISGVLSSHPKAPLLSLHHLDHVDPIFHSMDRFDSVNHLIESCKRRPILFSTTNHMLQQTIKLVLFTLIGLEIHIYERIIPRSILKVPLETFKPWVPNSEPPFYIFNTRPLLNDSCETHLNL